jgi:hypothetical protein
MTKEGAGVEQAALPFKSPVAVTQLLIEVYDPEFFVDFGPAERNPVRLIGAKKSNPATAPQL